MSTATATTPRTTSSTTSSTTTPPTKKRSPEQSAAILVRMPRLVRQLLHQAAERQGISVNQLVTDQLWPVLNAELEHQKQEELEQGNQLNNP